MADELLLLEATETLAADHHCQLSAGIWFLMRLNLRMGSEDRMPVIAKLAPYDATADGLPRLLCFRRGPEHLDC